MDHVEFASDVPPELVTIDVTPAPEMSTGTSLVISSIEAVNDDRINPPLPAVRVSTQQGGVRRFDYGFTKIQDIQVNTKDDPKKKAKQVESLVINDEPFLPTPRFWGSVLTLFGISSNIFHYFDHDEVFNRLAQKAANDRIRFCVQRDPHRPAEAPGRDPAREGRHPLRRPHPDDR